MRRLFAIATVIITLGTGTAAAKGYDEIPFAPMSPVVLGRGGSVIGDARGYDSLFYNPAGFSRDEGTFYLGETSSWIYSRPDALVGMFGKLSSGSSSSTTVLDFLNEQITRGGVGAGASWGIAYVGSGLGLGAVIIIDSLINGPSLLGAYGDLTATIGFIGGLSVPIDVAGFKIHVGGDVRPMIRMHTPLTNADAVNVLNALANGNDMLNALRTANALYGVGFGLDLGAIADFGWISAGLSIRDLAGTQFRYNTSSFSTLCSALSSRLEFPSSGTLVTDDTYTIPMDVGIGVNFHPDLGSVNNIIEPSVGVDMRDIVGALAGTANPWTLLHAGFELKLFSVFTLRSGLNQGYFTLGGGVRVWVFDMNFAVFTQELGDHIGDKPCSGMSLNASVSW